MSKKRLFIIGIIVLLIAISMIIAIKRTCSEYDTIYDSKVVDNCKSNLKAISVLLDVYQKNHKGSFPSGIEELFFDPNVITTKIFGIQGNPVGGEYRTRQERMKDLLMCPANRTPLSYLYRGDGIKVTHSQNLILMHDRIENHSNFVNILFNSKEQSVKTLSRDDFLKLLIEDNKLRKKNGLPEIRIIEKLPIK